MKTSKQFEDPLQFAAKLHREQARKATTAPYVSHLMAVAGLVMEFGGSEDQAIAALLHDAVDDQSEAHGGPDKLRAEIVRRCGTSVLSIIDACTDADTLPKRPREERKKAYIEHIPNHSQARVATAPWVASQMFLKLLGCFFGTAPLNGVGE